MAFHWIEFSCGVVEAETDWRHTGHRWAPVAVGERQGVSSMIHVTELG